MKLTRERLAVTVGAPLAVALLVAALPSAADARSADEVAPVAPVAAVADGDGSRPLTMDDVRPEAEALAEQFGVSPEEALQRLELQRRAAPLRARLAEEYPRVYGGMWIDQASGGKLKIHATNPAALRHEVHKAADPNRVVVVQKPRSLHQLRHQARRISHHLGRKRAAGVEVVVNEKDNRVEVRRPDTPAWSESPAAERLDRALAAHEGVEVTAYEPQEGEDKSGAPPSAPMADYDRSPYCQPASCDPPFRGGLRIDFQRDDGSFGGCTSGFNVRSAGGKKYVLTAAHCVTGPDHQHDDRGWHNGLPLVDEAQGVVKEYEENWAGRVVKDYALLPYYKAHTGQNWSEYWMGTKPGQNRVAIMPRCEPGSYLKPGWQCDHFDRYMKGTDGDLPYGTAVCQTGAGEWNYTGAPSGWHPGMRCGEVVVFGTDDLAVSNCTAPGDSGGPLYDPATNKAVGILHDGTPAQDGGHCGDDVNVLSRYFRVDKVLEWAEEKAGESFTLSTS